MQDGNHDGYRLGINVADKGSGICAVDINETGKPQRLRGISVRLRSHLANGANSSLAGEMTGLIAELVAEQGRPAQILVSGPGPDARSGLDLSRLAEVAGGAVPVHPLPGSRIADCRQSWNLADSTTEESSRFNARRVAIEAFATAVTGLAMDNAAARELRRILPNSLRNLVIIGPPESEMLSEPSRPRRHLDIFERPNGRWGTSGGSAPVMRLFEGDLLMVGFGDDQRILRVVRWGSRSNALWLAPSSESGDLRKRHHDAADPLRCMFVPVGRLKSLSARKIAVDRIGRVRTVADGAPTN